MASQPQFSFSKTRDNTFPVNVAVSAAIVTCLPYCFHPRTISHAWDVDNTYIHEKKKTHKQTDFCESTLKKKIFYRFIYYLVFLIYCCYVRKLKDFLFMDNTHFKIQSTPPLQFNINTVSFIRIIFSPC